MGGRHFAVFLSIGTLVICFIISLLCFSYLYYSKLMPQAWKRYFIKPKTILLLSATFILAPLLVGTGFRIGGYLEKGNGIHWGCYIEFYWVGFMLMQIISFTVSFIICVCALFMPQYLRFESRLHACKLFAGHNLYTMLLGLLIGLLIPYIAGSINGASSSCW